MNTLILLAATACTPAAGPQPVMSSQPAAMPVYGNSGASEWSGPVQEGRPRFFARLRGLFSRKPQGLDGQTVEPPPAYSYGLNSNSAVGGTVINPGTSFSSGTGSVSSSPATLRSQPAFAPSSGAAQRMPTGQPF